MGLSNAKVLIASDGEKTFVLVNGTPLIGSNPCRELPTPFLHSLSAQRPSLRLLC